MNRTAGILPASKIPQSDIIPTRDNKVALPHRYNAIFLTVDLKEVINVERFLISSGIDRYTSTVE